MSFSLSNIKLINIRTRKQQMSELSKILYSNVFLTDNIRYALWEYIKFRVFSSRYGDLLPESFYNMINELIEYVIGKNINLISLQDIYSNENQIIYEIANSIFCKNMHKLYRVSNLKQVVEKNFKDRPKKLPQDKKLTNKELEDYFRRIMK